LEHTFAILGKDITVGTENLDLGGLDVALRAVSN